LQNSNNHKDCAWFDSFVDDTRRGLANYIRQIVSSADDLQGVMQDAYLKVFIALRKERPDDHAPVALLYRVARNLAISRLRHEKVVMHTLPAVIVAEELRTERRTAEQRVVASQKRNELMLVIGSLPPRCRDVFVLRWIRGFNHRDIGERLGISVSTVEKHLAKGLRLCRAELRRRAEAGAPADESAGPLKDTGS
jgi:RNA polymerase sigma-70 factor (ECF subfamily)